MIDYKQQKIDKAIEDKNKRIEKATKEKYARMDKTATSIMICWAYNCAIASVGVANPENWGYFMAEVEKRYPWFIEKYQEKILERLEIPKEDMSEWQEDYNKLAQLDDIKAEENLPIIEK